jgi:hypothetical protein
MNSLTAIFNKYDSDKNSYFHNYCRQYEKILDKYSKGLGVYGESIYNLLHEISVKIQEHETNDI